MKTLSLKIAGTIALFLLSFSILAQDWRVGGNTLLQLGGNPPILGTTVGNNNPLSFATNGINRMQLTQNNTATINGFTVDNSGFLGLSANPGFFNTFTPYALLHLNGVNPLGNPQQDGYRAWMRHGIVSTHNQDLMFIGQKANDDDVTDAVIAWSDKGGRFFSHELGS